MSTLTQVIGVGGYVDRLRIPRGTDLVPGPHDSTTNPATAPRRARRPSAKAQRREQAIYDAAAEIFDRKGYAATSLNDIGEAVGLLKGSLYYYIGSKEDLLYQITRTIHDGAMANLEAARAAGPDPETQLAALVVGHITVFEERNTWIRVFYTEYGHLTGERRQQTMALRRRYENYVEGLIRAGQDTGVFCAAKDPRVMSNAILTMVNSVFLWYRPDRDDRLDGVAEAYAEFILGGLRCPADHDHS
ncbi:MAG: TetR/AcrR family transcriptional regulator [Acidimicrobiales bacterium]